MHPFPKTMITCIEHFTVFIQIVYYNIYIHNLILGPLSSHLSILFVINLKPFC